MLYETDTIRRPGYRLARRARSFKQDIIDKLNQIRSPSATRSSSPHNPFGHQKHQKNRNSPIKGFENKKSQKTSKKEKDINHAKVFEKQLASALRYFQDVVEKDKLEQLSGSASIILEIVLTGYQELKAYLIYNEQSSLVISATNKVYQSLAELIRWSDNVSLNCDKTADKQSVTAIVNDVTESVQSLVQLCIERYKRRDNSTKSGKNSSKVSAVQPMTQTLGRLGSKKPNQLNLTDNLSNASPHRSSLPEIPLSPREKEILSETEFSTPPAFQTGFCSHSLSSGDLIDSVDSGLDPPPKPPLATIEGRPVSVSDILDIDCRLDKEGVEEPPPLPPKRIGRTDKKIFSQTSLDCCQTCQSSVSTSNYDSMDSSLNYSGINHLSADDLLSMSRSDVESRDYVRQYRSQTNSYNTNSSSDDTRSSESYNFNRYESKVVTSKKTITQKTSHSLNINSNEFVLSDFSPLNSLQFPANNRFESLIDRMKSMKTSVSEDTVDGDLPPQLPVKMRPKKKLSLSDIQSILDVKPLRPPSEYDNMPDLTLDDHNSSHKFFDDFRQTNQNKSNGFCSHSSSCPHFKCNPNNDKPIDPNNLENRPPPLPPKKKNIIAYVQMFGSYSGPDDPEFYRHSVHTYQLVQRQMQAVEMSFIQQKSITNSIVSATSSADSVFSFESDYSLTPPPLLPPKKSKCLKEPPPKPNQSPDINPRTSTPISLVPSSESGISSQSELTRVEAEDLTELDQIDVSSYIILKNPSEEGPDIRGGTVDGLIVKATEVSKNDFMFQEAFLTTYRTLVSPMDLINKLIYRYNKFILLSDMRQRAAKNAFALLVRAVDDMCLGDCEPKVLQILMDFIYQLVIRGDLALAKVLRVKCIEKMNDKKNVNSGSVLLPSINITIKQFSLCDFKAEHLAEQMTLLDSELFNKIEIPEVLVWAKEQKEELIPNLNKFTEHFNKMSYWTRSRILEQEDPKERERLVQKFIKIMKHLRKMSNFNSYLAILSALDSAPVRRLEWQKSITESLKEYSALIDSSSSFRAYRQALSDTEPPCIPYIGLILQDLTFVHIGNNDYLSDGNINFGKRWQQYNILDQMRRFRNCHYPYKRNEQIIGVFSNFEDCLSEEAMWQISESIKPRGVTKKH